MAVVNNADLSRYEIRVDDQLVGWAEYQVDGSTYVFTHTEITPDLQGRGLGAALVRDALDDVRRAGGSVEARCSFVADFIDRNPAYADLLAA